MEVLQQLVTFSLCLAMVTHAMVMEEIQAPAPPRRYIDMIENPLSFDEVATAPFPTPGGVTFLGVGYNILTGNPEGNPNLGTVILVLDFFKNHFDRRITVIEIFYKIT